MNVMLMGCLALGLAAGVTLAQPGPEGCPGRGKGQGQGGLQIGRLVHDDVAARKAGITDEQLAALREVLNKSKGSMIDLRAQKEKAQLQMDQLMDSDAPNKAEFDKLTDEIGRIQTEIRKTFMGMQWEAREILGAGKYKELVKKQWRNVRTRGGRKGAMQTGEGRAGCPMMSDDEDAAPAADEQKE